MHDPTDKLDDQFLYSPGAFPCGPSPGPLSPPSNSHVGGQATPQLATPIKAFTAPEGSTTTGAPPGECSGSNIHNEDMYDLTCALLKAEATGERSSVVKEEIRHLIKNKRRLSGYQSPERSPKKTQADILTAQDEERRQRRKASNRRAATKCREKKKVADDVIKQKCTVLEGENKKLKHQIASLEGQLQKYRDEIVLHKKHCNLNVQSFTPTTKTASPACSVSCSSGSYLPMNEIDTEHQRQVSSITSSSSTVSISSGYGQVVVDAPEAASVVSLGKSHQDVVDDAVFIQPHVSVSTTVNPGMPNADQSTVGRPAAETANTVTQLALPEFVTIDRANYVSIFDAIPEQEVPQYIGTTAELPVFNSDELQKYLNP